MVLPYLVIYLFLPTGLPFTLKTLVYLIAPGFVYSLHVTLRTSYHRYRARQLGACMIPIIDPAFKPKGSPWYMRIGNLDLMLAWDREGREGYLGEGMVRDAVDGAGGTVNTRILGEDSVSV
jgi:hypothetical protein